MADFMTAKDRCDSCGAQAYVRVILTAGIIDLCAHEYRVHEVAIAAAPGLIEVHDERHRLTSANEARAKEGVS